MRSFFKFFAKRQLFANLVTLSIIGLGLLTLPNIKRDMFPRVDLGEVVITTRYEGAAPKDVELFVTNKLEKELKKDESLNIFNFLNDFYNKIEQIDIEYILNEELSVFNEKDIDVNDLFGSKGCKAIMIAANIGGVRLIDNLIVK